MIQALGAYFNKEELCFEGRWAPKLIKGLCNSLN